ncbi:MAG: type 4a pilus biogenesis protein PilO [Gammaproteobacteria bacterium]|nr:type 4a pilus biogenesis protein PilO [Gammaproteobacteria bacterium]NIO61738.1 type 4a pilus biogenesis protein PilO [Gammaproteobacteria bacterium]NIP48608.1 type 4a pilus biogenesis protein PilO [Gammaproteobacteria bacterium]NIQ09060.1 type 4a pilus biogenesis protein PilO [Gammaproteobacteria bacterium]NIQ18989.1 type 4a pilus biogenesis protein PilO [Gammaproteobacteria bacterium]
MTFDDLQNLDFENIGDWPFSIKAVAASLVIVAIVGAGYWFDVKAQREELAVAERKEVELMESLERKQKKAANLDALKVQLEEIKQSFGDMLKQLPNKTEVAALLVDISQTGLAAGLEFELFKPENEQPAEFYAELPIKISVIGDYHQLGEFISGVASLPRIVTTHDISISRKKTKEETQALQMQATAKTYRALDEEEFEEEARARSKKGRKGRRR